MADHRVAERIWWGSDARARAARVALSPAAALFGAAVRVRNALYDAGVLASRALPMPAISVGNLSVGGTGKTPVAAWLAARVKAMGATPAVVLRGYGDDEPAVHRRLNPGIPVIVDADRLEAARRARSVGADLVVLDDAFQHRRVRREVDLVLVSAERWTGATPLLPAGPWREPMASIRRASMVLVTRKSAGRETAASVAAAVAASTPEVPVGIAELGPASLAGVAGDAELSLEVLEGTRVLAIAAIGDPAAFARQLEALGGRVQPAFFSDHHAFTDADAEELARRAESVDLAVCTLKDAVKLASRWPRQAPPLWYVSQRVVIERGDEALAVLIGKVVQARATHRLAAAPLP